MNNPLGLNLPQHVLEQLGIAGVVQQKVDPRPLLQPGDAPGYVKSKRIDYVEYPKAIYPPKVVVKNRFDEERCRQEWKQPLPWLPNSEKAAIDAYYAQQTYPKVMEPPPLMVESAKEEAIVRASWKDTGAEAVDTDSYPKTFFHLTLPPVVVRTREEEEALGPGWYPTIAAVIAAVVGTAPVAMDMPAKVAGQEAPAETDPERMKREELFAALKARGIRAVPPISNDELRAMLKDAMASVEAAAA